MTVDILCKVVDNLGDIGFVYRLARALSELPDAPDLRLIVDDLDSFAGLCPAVDPVSALQRVGDWQVVRWDDPGEAARQVFMENRPRMVLECYACGRPDWFESILFDPTDTRGRQIINLEYLTAESWAPDFHRLPSLTRSPLVRKSIFMPGFQAGTGGLVQDSAFCALLDRYAAPDGRSVLRASLDFPDDTRMWVLVFSYEHDFTTIVGDLAVFNAERPLRVLLAHGRCAAPFLEAWNRAGQPFPLQALPLLPQPAWDAFLVASDFLLVRGEETLARSVLSGKVFLWQCYPFALEEGGSGEGGQFPKVRSFLELIKPFLDDESFRAYQRLTEAYNGMSGSEPAPGDLLAVLRSLSPVNSDEIPSPLSAGFASWSQEVRNLGNLALNLLTYMREIG